VYARLRIVFTSPDIISIQAPINCLLTTPKKFGKLISIEVWIFFFYSKNFFSCDLDALSRYICSLYSRHAGISKTENISNIDNQEASWLYNIKMQTYNFCNQFSPFIIGDILLIVFADMIWRRPEATGDRVIFDLL